MNSIIIRTFPHKHLPIYWGKQAGGWVAGTLPRCLPSGRVGRRIVSAPALSAPPAHRDFFANIITCLYCWTGTYHLFLPCSCLLCQHCICELLQRGCDVRHVLSKADFVYNHPKKVGFSTKKHRSLTLPKFHPFFRHNMMMAMVATWMILLMTAWLTRSSNL